MTEKAMAASEVPNEQAETGKTPGDHIGTILMALADALHETVARFEETAGGVTHLVAKPVSGPNKDLVVTLQNFDRLQQEFAALAGVLKRYGGLATGLTSGENCPVAAARELIEGITVAEFRDRLLNRMPTMVPVASAEPPADEDEEKIF
ncbi:MAG TPA: hypothetical protein VFB45_01370 [Pseudolabrys sp.]|nr:hypothetical protein [Pseudolabrys sp.]